MEETSGGDCQGVSRWYRYKTQKAELTSTRNGGENGSLPHCATVASHSRPSTKGYTCALQREAETQRGMKEMHTPRNRSNKSHDRPRG